MTLPAKIFRGVGGKFIQSAAFGSGGKLVTTIADCCCGSDNTDPCAEGCCSSIKMQWAAIDAGFSLTAGIADCKCQPSGSEFSTGAHFDDPYLCAPLTLRFMRTGGYWYCSPVGGSAVFRTKLDTWACPPAGADNWQFDSSGDATDYILTSIQCCDGGDLDSSPDTITVSGWSGNITFSNAADVYTGPPNFTLWDGTLTRDTPGFNRWLTGGAFGFNRSIQVVPGSPGKFIDVQVALQIGGFGRLDCQITWTSGIAGGFFQWAAACGAYWDSTLGLVTLENFSGSSARIRVPFELVTA